MSKYYVPAPPLPEWRNAARENNLQRPPYARVSAASKQLAPLDAAFVGRTLIATLWLGALLVVVDYGLTHSLRAVWSFGGGVALSVLMLKSQQFFVSYLIARWRSQREVKPASGVAKYIPAWILPPVKYLVIFTGLGLLLHYQFIEPLSFVAGFTVLQFVIIARTMGRLIAHKARPLNEVYVQPFRTKDVSDVS